MTSNVSSVRSARCFHGRSRLQLPQRHSFLNASVSRVRDRKRGVVATLHDGSTTSSKIVEQAAAISARGNRCTSTVPAGEEDGKKKAFPFDKNAVSRLTPTMKNFTLEGKVAVVTGYASHYLVRRYML